MCPTGSSWALHLTVTYTKNRLVLSAISGFRHAIGGIFALLRYYAASSGNHLPTFQDNLLVPSSGGKEVLSSWTS
jgi:hypothetical protein